MNINKKDRIPLTQSNPSYPGGLILECLINQDVAIMHPFCSQQNHIIGINCVPIASLAHRDKP